MVRLVSAPGDQFFFVFVSTSGFIFIWLDCVCRNYIDFSVKKAAITAVFHIPYSDYMMKNCPATCCVLFKLSCRPFFSPHPNLCKLTCFCFLSDFNMYGCMCVKNKKRLNFIFIKKWDLLEREKNGTKFSINFLTEMDFSFVNLNKWAP